VEADAQIRLLHDQQRGVAAADGQEIGAAEEQVLPPSTASTSAGGRHQRAHRAHHDALAEGALRWDADFLDPRPPWQPASSARRLSART
jgi:hypothetical protein